MGCKWVVGKTGSWELQVIACNRWAFKPAKDGTANVCGVKQQLQAKEKRFLSSLPRPHIRGQGSIRICFIFFNSSCFSCRACGKNADFPNHIEHPFFFNPSSLEDLQGPAGKTDCLNMKWLLRGLRMLRLAWNNCLRTEHALAPQVLALLFSTSRSAFSCFSFSNSCLEMHLEKERERERYIYYIYIYIIIIMINYVICRICINLWCILHQSPKQFLATSVSCLILWFLEVVKDGEVGCWGPFSPVMTFHCYCYATKPPKIT